MERETTVEVSDEQAGGEATCCGEGGDCECEGSDCPCPGDC